MCPFGKLVALFCFEDKGVQIFFCGRPPEQHAKTQHLFLISLHTLIPPCCTAVSELLFPLYPQQPQSLLELFASQMQVHLFNVALAQGSELEDFVTKWGPPLCPVSCQILLHLLAASQPESTAFSSESGGNQRCHWFHLLHPGRPNQHFDARWTSGEQEFVFGPYGDAMGALR